MSSVASQYLYNKPWFANCCWKSLCTERCLACVVSLGIVVNAANSHRVKAHVNVSGLRAVDAVFSLLMQ